ncbi:MAG: molecular chaperone DnaJ [Acidimicrobiaceae bacterium]|jgi:curved DNA-binding protein CbpA
MTTHYHVLGVPTDADDTELVRAYRRRASQLHPDHNRGDAGALAAMVNLNLAWWTLRDPHRRADYDRSLAPESATPTAARPYSPDDEEWSSAPSAEARRWRLVVTFAAVLIVAVLIVFTIIAIAGSANLGPESGGYRG